MAMATPTEPSIPPATSLPSKKLPSNPTPLSAPQEQQVRDLYYKNVRSKCASEIAAFATCATGRTFTMAWACRQQKLAMNNCMIQYQNQEEFDKARAEWFQLAGERKRQREEMERKIEEGRRKHKEWWGLDEEGKLQGKRVEVHEEELKKR
ncbi:hypothetical protein BU26DRAFT_460323 [Trematosphaeria pertusa]|uniref:COX assembly mitochondrial protein n=1 Tax=Trematosphaeria pertusa TaxID=390896 RepID=A0A6A6I8V4_9PLEO|nr:uncharacterized protein BU26DRAFT_460323 [Trematosphaeria pertusa]KAF2246508.1 hypothetical protein BU26DRAFT_460323 [Trematosphaeria pertusa]